MVLGPCGYIRHASRVCLVCCKCPLSAWSDRDRKSVCVSGAVPMTGFLGANEVVTRGGRELLTIRKSNQPWQREYISIEMKAFLSTPKTISRFGTPELNSLTVGVGRNVVCMCVCACVRVWGRERLTVCSVVGCGFRLTRPPPPSMHHTAPAANWNREELVKPLYYKYSAQNTRFHV